MIEPDKRRSIASPDTFAGALGRHRLVRFLLVGLVNTAFSYGVYALMLYFGLNYAAASLIALVLGILFSFRTQGTFVFYNSDKSRFGRFVLAWSAVYICNVAFIRTMLALGLGAYVAGALALPITTLLSYVIQKHFVFHRSPSSPTPPA
jgi:putative flippase GtrA